MSEVAVDRPRRPLVCFGPFTFDPNGQVLRRGTTELTLPPRVLAVLQMLLDRAGDLVPRQVLIENVWKDAFVTDTSLAEAVSFLRQALGDDPQSPTYVQTVHRRGYRFIAPIQTRQAVTDTRIDARTESPLPADEQVSPSISGFLLPWSAAALLGTLAVVALWQLTHQRAAPDGPATRFTVLLSDGLRFDTRGPAMTISPDGSNVAWAACQSGACHLYLRPIDRLDAVALAGTEDASNPFFSPDGRWVGFFAAGKLKKIPIAGGPLSTLADASQPYGAVWTPDHRIIFAASVAGGLLQASEDGGQPTVLTVPRQDQGELAHAWPSLTADGTAVLFSVRTTLHDDAPSRLAIGRLERGGRPLAWSTVLTGIGLGRAAARDLLVFSRGGELDAVAFDPVRLVVSGVPRTVVPSIGAGDVRPEFALSAAGTVIYGTQTASNDHEGLAWWTPSGVAPVADGVRNAPGGTLSPDGRSLAWTAPDGARSDLWVGDLQRGAVTRLTHDATNVSPAWSPDGRTVYFARRTEGAFRIASIAADGGKPVDVAGSDRQTFPASVSADGRTVAVVQASPSTRADIWAVPADGGVARSLVQTPFDEIAPALSSTGLMAYQSDEAGRWDIYAQRLTDGKRVVVSTSGGESPFWSIDGLTLLYRCGTRLMSVPIFAHDMRVGTPAAVLELNDARVRGIAPDGRVLLERRAPAPAHAVMVLDWVRELRELLGPPDARMPR